MKRQDINEQFSTIYDLAVQLSKAVDADALLVLVEAPTDWGHLKRRAGREKIIIAADNRCRALRSKLKTTRPLSWATRPQMSLLKPRRGH